mgnify:CR=1 FL=1
MEHVRLPLLSQDFLIQRVEEEPLIKNNSVCKDYLIEAMKFHLLRPEQKLLYCTPRTKLRSPAGLPKVCVNLLHIFCLQLVLLLSRLEDCRLDPYFVHYIAQFCIYYISATRYYIANEVCGNVLADYEHPTLGYLFSVQCT